MAFKSNNNNNNSNNTIDNVRMPTERFNTKQILNGNSRDVNNNNNE